MITAIPITITDPVYHPEKGMSRLNQFIASLLNDARNLPFVYFSILLLFTTVTGGVLLFIPGIFHWWLAGLYFLMNVSLFMGPFILMLHNTSHNILFKRKYKFLNYIIPWIIGPFFGLTPETYFAHHIGMHHPENNLPPDLSTTMKSQRDSFGDFMKYFLRFFFIGMPELSYYLKKKNRIKLLKRLLSGEFSYILLSILLLFVNWKADLMVFIIPLVFVRFMMMAGNWAQHAFIDQNAAENCYKNSITFINSSYNKRCWNDGYHIGHHLYPKKHWTDMPEEFLKNIEKYKNEDALVFRKIDYFTIWFFLMTKNYNALSKYYVELNAEKPRNKNEIIDFLKERTRKFK